MRPVERDTAPRPQVGARSERFVQHRHFLRPRPGRRDMEPRARLLRVRNICDADLQHHLVPRHHLHAVGADDFTDYGQLNCRDGVGLDDRHHGRAIPDQRAGELVQLHVGCGPRGRFLVRRRLERWDFGPGLQLRHSRDGHLREDLVLRRLLGPQRRSSRLLHPEPRVPLGWAVIRFADRGDAGHDDLLPLDQPRRVDHVRQQHLVVSHGYRTDLPGDHTDVLRPSDK